MASRTKDTGEALPEQACWRWFGQPRSAIGSILRSGVGSGLLSAKHSAYPGGSNGLGRWSSEPASPQICKCCCALLHAPDLTNPQPSWLGRLQRDQLSGSATIMPSLVLYSNYPCKCLFGHCRQVLCRMHLVYRCLHKMHKK